MNPLQEHLWPLYPRLIDLGASLFRWRSIWTRDLDVSGLATVPTPVNDTDAATKLYVDDRIGLFLIREVDLAPSVSTVTILEFDQADGFVLTNPSAGRVRVDIGTLPVANGGTGLITYTIGDLIYASGATTLTTLADVAAGAYLRSGGVGAAPLWSTPTLPNTATPSGAYLRADGTNWIISTATLPNTAAQGDVLYASAASVYSNLVAGTAGQVLQTGGAGANPSWGTFLRLAGSSTTEGTSAAGADADIVSVTLTNSIPVGTPFIIVASLRKTTGAAAASSVGLKLNTTIVKPIAAFTTAANSVQQGMVVYFIGGWDGTNYTFPEFGMTGSDALSMVFINNSGTAIPNAAITTVVIRGNSGSALITMGVKNVYIYTLGV